MGPGPLWLISWPFSWNLYVMEWSVLAVLQVKVRLVEVSSTEPWLLALIVGVLGTTGGGQRRGIKEQTLVHYLA